MHKEAIINLQKALSFTDDKVDVWSLLGMEYLYLDDFENARLNFENCIKVDLKIILHFIMLCIVLIWKKSMSKQLII